MNNKRKTEILSVFTEIEKEFAVDNNILDTENVITKVRSKTNLSIEEELFLRDTVYSTNTSLIESFDKAIRDKLNSIENIDVNSFMESVYTQVHSTILKGD